MPEALAALVTASLRYFPTLVLVWPALFFGRMLRNGEVSLIECVARVGKPRLSPALCRYTRGLRALWCVYFLVAALLTIVAKLGFGQASLGVASLTIVFFVGEHWVRRRLLFRHEPFRDWLNRFATSFASGGF